MLSRTCCLEHFTEVDWNSFLATNFGFGILGLVKDGGKLGPTYVITHMDSSTWQFCALDLTCHKGDVEGDVFERGFGPVVGTWYLGSCKRYYRTAKSRTYGSFFPTLACLARHSHETQPLAA